MTSMVRLAQSCGNLKREIMERRSSPTIGSDGTVYVGSNDNKLYAINGQTGAKLWNLKREVRTHLSTIGPDGTVYVGSLTTSSMPSMARLRSSSGNLKRELPCTPPPLLVLMARFTSGHLTISSMPSMVRLGPSFGNLSRSSVHSSSAVGSDGTVYVGSSDNKLYAINGQTGAKLWEFETGHDALLSHNRLGWHGLRRVK